MNKLIWKYADPLPDVNELDLIEEQYGFVIPKDLRTCLIANNGGRPNKMRLPLRDGGEVEFGYLLSFGPDEVEDFYEILENFSLCDNGRLKMFPFARDPAGNLFCVRDNDIVFLDHETDEIFPVYGKFTQLLERLVD